jgi:transcriptional regulator with XRE-family HTH domain
MNGIKFAERIKELRMSKNMTMEELGNQLKKTKSTISTWEKGTRSPKMGELETIAKFFNVSIDYLLGLSDTNTQAITTKQYEDLEILMNSAQNYLKKDPENKKYQDFFKKVKDTQKTQKSVKQFEELVNQQFLFEYGKSTKEILIIENDDQRETAMKIVDIIPQLTSDNLTKILEYSEMLLTKQSSSVE